jgi:hypothetical protein
LAFAVPVKHKRHGDTALRFTFYVLLTTAIGDTQHATPHGIVNVTLADTLGWLGALAVAVSWYVPGVMLLKSGLMLHGPLPPKAQ